jgi:hypothetical protein
MELREFIKAALLDITGAVVDARKELPEGHGEIVPAARNNYRSVETGISDFQVVEFDVAVRIDDSKSSGAKLTVKAAIFGGGEVQGASESSRGQDARIKFRIPIKLPK